MRLTIVTRLAYLLYAGALLAWGAPQRAATAPGDGAANGLVHVQRLSEVSISPDGARVAWVQTHEDPATGMETLSIYTHEAHAGGMATRVTAGNGSAEL